MVMAGRRLFRTQSFHYEVAQAVRIAVALLGKFDNKLGDCHGQRIFPIRKLQRAQRLLERFN
jgi:hypothetical protein